jgi:hypothetical protein
MHSNSGVRNPERILAFDPWLHDVAALTMEALASDLDAEAALLRIAAELAAIAEAIRGDTYALAPAKAPERLAVEALLTATAPHTDNTQRRWVLGYCQQARSLAEIAAYGGVPLGVARTVVGEMLSAGLLQLQLPPPVDDEFVERLRRAIRDL